MWDKFLSWLSYMIYPPSAYYKQQAANWQQLATYSIYNRPLLPKENTMNKIPFDFEAFKNGDVAIYIDNGHQYTYVAHNDCQIVVQNNKTKNFWVKEIYWYGASFVMKPKTEKITVYSDGHGHYWAAKTDPKTTYNGKVAEVEVPV